MCFTAEQFRPTNATTEKPAAAPSTTLHEDGGLLRKLVLNSVSGGIPQRVREAGLGTSIKPRPLGTVVKDPTRQG